MKLDFEHLITKYNYSNNFKFNDLNADIYITLYTILFSDYTDIPSLKSIIKNKNNDINLDYILEYLKLSTSNDRVNFKYQVINYDIEIDKFYNDKNIASYKILNNIYKNIRNENIYKGILIYTFNTNRLSTQLKIQIIDLLKKISSSKAKFFFKDILKEIAFMHNITPILSPVEKEFEDLRNSLDISEQEIDNLKENIKDIKETAKFDAIVSFLRDLNSKDGNNILDQFSISANTIKQLKKENFSFPDPIQSIPVVVRLFMQFINSLGILPINKIGDNLKIDINSSEDYDYIGTPFVGDEIKNVIVETPGWKYENQIISKPKIKELIY